MNLPRGYFEFDYEGQRVKGRLCLWSMERFKDRTGIADVNSFMDLLNGMSVKSLSLLLLCCVEYVCVKESKSFEYNEVHGYDWIEDQGAQKIAEMLGGAFDLPEDDGKKKAESPSPGAD